jgi:hypothetical protein
MPALPPACPSIPPRCTAASAGSPTARVPPLWMAQSADLVPGQFAAMGSHRQATAVKLFLWDSTRERTNHRLTVL